MARDDDQCALWANFWGQSTWVRSCTLLIKHGIGKSQFAMVKQFTNQELRAAIFENQSSKTGQESSYQSLGLKRNNVWNYCNRRPSIFACLLVADLHRKWCLAMAQSNSADDHRYTRTGPIKHEMWNAVLVINSIPMLCNGSQQPALFDCAAVENKDAANHCPSSCVACGDEVELWKC